LVQLSGRNIRAVTMYTIIQERESCPGLSGDSAISCEIIRGRISLGRKHLVFCNRKLLDGDPNVGKRGRLIQRMRFFPDIGIGRQEIQAKARVSIERGPGSGASGEKDAETLDHCRCVTVRRNMY
jgi:hypothetical protein